MAVSKSLRRKIIEQDDFACSECGRTVSLSEEAETPTGHVHHIVPEAKGGGDSPSNLTTVCPKCHAERHPQHGIGGQPSGFLNDSDHAILEVLDEGRATPTLVRDTLRDRGKELSRQYISERIKRLNEHGVLCNLKNTGLYELVDDPRES